MIQEKRNNCLNLVRISNRKINEVRYSESESEDHIAMKRDICTQLILDGKQFITEAIFETGGRAKNLLARVEHQSSLERLSIIPRREVG